MLGTRWNLCRNNVPIVNDRFEFYQFPAARGRDRSRTAPVYSGK